MSDLGKRYFERVTQPRILTEEDVAVIKELVMKEKPESTTQRDKLIKFLLDHYVAEKERGYGHATAEDIADLLIDNNWITDMPWSSAYNDEFGDDKVCACGHVYYRHFDSYDDMFPIGCKYCPCGEFHEN